jgi:nickel/cobalt transporter (NiCoT) family protein
MAEILLAWVLGFKHGLDADHLALIDNLSRLLRARSPRTARYAGLLFSLGHGLALTLACVLIAGFGKSAQMQLPAWLDGSGAVFAASALLVVALLNLSSLLRRGTRLDIRAPLWIKRLHPALAALGVMALGISFALSLDTLTQASVFAGLSQNSQQTLFRAASLGATFAFGMIFADTLNGLFVSSLLDRLGKRADRGSNPHSQVHANHHMETRQEDNKALQFLTWSLSCLSILVALLALARLSHRDISQALQGHDLYLGLAVILWVFGSYLVAAGISFLPAKRSRQADRA